MPKLLLALATFLMAASAFAQPCADPDTRIWLQIQNREGLEDTLWFGFDSTATYGLNPHLCEFEVPPVPPSCPWWLPFFANIPGREGQDSPQGLGMGVWRDYRPYVNPSQVDTHRVRFWSADSFCNPGYPTILRWSRSLVAALSDSTIMVDEYGGLFHRVRMDVNDSLNVTLSGITGLLIFRYGARNPSVGVSSDPEVFPRDVTLLQNYPNPFNPSTRIEYQLPRKELVILKVYDVLGREVATLVNQVQSPGAHSVEFAGGSLPSGVYFYRMEMTGISSGRSFVQTEKMMLIK